MIARRCEKQLGLIVVFFSHQKVAEVHRLASRDDGEYRRSPGRLPDALDAKVPKGLDGFLRPRRGINALLHRLKHLSGATIVVVKRLAKRVDVTLREGGKHA